MNTVHSTPTLTSRTEVYRFDEAVVVEQSVRSRFSSRTVKVTRHFDDGGTERITVALVVPLHEILGHDDGEYHSIGRYGGEVPIDVSDVPAHLVGIH